MTTAISEACLEELARTPYYSSALENEDKLRLVLSEEDVVSYRALEERCYPEGSRRGSKARSPGIVKAFASPSYGDAAKECFAAVHLSDEFILSSAGKFFTEKILFSFVERPTAVNFRMPYFSALMGSEHLSERIVLSAMLALWASDRRKALTLIPDIMITPVVMNRWIRSARRMSDDFEGVAGERIKRAHPEYEGFPDEWVLNIFCRE